MADKFEELQRAIASLRESRDGLLKRLIAIERKFRSLPPAPAIPSDGHCRSCRFCWDDPESKVKMPDEDGTCRVDGPTRHMGVMYDYACGKYDAIRKDELET